MSHSYLFASSDAGPSHSPYAPFPGVNDGNPSCGRPASIKSTASSSSAQSISSTRQFEDIAPGQTYSAYVQARAQARARERERALAKKNVNVYTTCGRHSNEWLFSGWSFHRTN